MSSRQDTAGTFVLGLDGVPWNLVSRWAGEGHLPNLARLIEEGASGPLRSSVPANTPVAWPSIATGTRPDRHGIYEFVRLDQGHGQRPYNSTDLRVPPLWELLSPAAVLNVPMTYPAGEFDGRLVAGMMSPGPASKGFTHPASLADELGRSVPEYAVGLDWKEYYGEDERFLEDLRGMVEARRRALDLLVKPDDALCFAVFTAPDRLQHLVWDEATLRRQYAYFDEVVGEVIERCERENRRLFVVSDHGFGEIDTLVSVNRLLAEEGLFVERENTRLRRLLSATGLSKDRVLAGLERVGITDDWLVERLPESVVTSAANRIPGDHALYDMAPERTDAFLHGLGSVYVNDTRRFTRGRVPPAEVPAVKERVMTALRALRDPETGEQVLEVYDGGERHPRDEFAPDVVVEGRERFRVVSNLADTVFSDPGPKAADHRPEGILLAWGPDVDAGVSLAGANVVDVAPTVLHAAGRPVPTHMDGAVLTEVFAPESGPATREVERADYEATDRATVNTDSDEVRDRLRGLGYID